MGRERLTEGEGNRLAMRRQEMPKCPLPLATWRSVARVSGEWRGGRKPDGVGQGMSGGKERETVNVDTAFKKFDCEREETEDRGWGCGILGEAGFVFRVLVFWTGQHE